MKRIRSFSIVTANGKSAFLIRLLVGGVFFSEGIQKFLFPEELGIGRFEKIGIPMANVLAPFVGTVEVICGAAIIMGIFTGLASLPLLIDIGVAIYKTKVPLFTEKGFWVLAHESRVDYCMLLGLLFLMMKA